jgi:hemolysin activation/secretion protein
LGADLAFNSPLGIGDQVTLRALTSDQSLVYGYVAYQAPVGGMGLRLGGAYADTQYRLGKELAASKSYGSATIGSLFAVYPFIRSQSSNLSGTFTWEDKHLGDVISATHLDKQVRAETLGLTGNLRDAFGGGGITLFEGSVTTGKLSMDAASLWNDNLSAHTNGAFTRLNYSITRLQRLDDSNSLSLALSGQRANKNLNSSEQFTLGGANGVRAYPQGEAYGDRGQVTSVELRHNFMQTFQGVIFYDAGLINVNRNPYLPGANTRFISGEGVGENANLAGFQVKAFVALRGRGGQPTSEPAVRSSNYRLWVQVGKQF